MITLSSTLDLSTAQPLGTLVSVDITRADPAVETRAFLSHRPVIYPAPLRDWTLDSAPLAIFPESPGTYRLDVEWRSVPHGEHGRASLDIVIEAGDAAWNDPSPAEVPIDGGTLWVPNAFETAVLHDEIEGLLERLVEPGAVVYDIGANVGFYASAFARHVGPEGQVVCFEANPVCVQWLRTNLLRQGFDQTQIVPIAALDRSGETQFRLNFGNSNLGVSGASEHFAYKAGHEISVPCHPVDDMVEALDLPRPDLIKLDVEGAEAQALTGLRRTLERHRPTLLLELHGEHCLRQSLSILTDYDYLFENPGDWAFDTPEDWRVMSTVDEVAELFGDAVVQLVARTAPDADL